MSDSAPALSAGRRPRITISFCAGMRDNPEQAELWDAIRLHTEQIGFNHFAEFIRQAFAPTLRRPSSQISGLGDEGGRPTDHSAANALTA